MRATVHPSDEDCPRPPDRGRRTHTLPSPSSSAWHPWPARRERLSHDFTAQLATPTTQFSGSPLAVTPTTGRNRRRSEHNWHMVRRSSERSVYTPTTGRRRSTAGEVALLARVSTRTECDHQPWRVGRGWAVPGGRERAYSRGHRHLTPPGLIASLGRAHPVITRGIGWVGR